MIAFICSQIFLNMLNVMLGSSNEVEQFFHLTNFEVKKTIVMLFFLIKKPEVRKFAEIDINSGLIAECSF